MQCRCKSYLFTSSSQENPFTYGEKKRRSHFECDQGRASGLVFTEQRRTAAAESTSLCRRYCSQRPCWFAVRCIRSGRSRSPRLVRSDASVPVNNCQLCVDRWGHGGRPFPCEFHVPCWHLCSQVQAWTASALRGDGITAMA